MALRVYEINTTAGKRYAIGVFTKSGQMLRGASPKYYKSKKAAHKALIRRKAR